MITKKYIFMLILLVVVGSMQEKFKGITQTDEEKRHYELVKTYLLNDVSLERCKLPILWIHVENNINARWWKSFGSRNTKCLNQPYQYLTIKSIVDKCGEHFNICLIDDRSFEKLIPDWKTNMSILSPPIKEKMREIGLARLLYMFGGMLVPSTFICFRDLHPIYQAGVVDNQMFVGEFVDRNITAEHRDAYPNTRLMGCNINNQTMLMYINFLQNMTKHDYTDESIFLGTKDKWCLEQAHKNIVKIIKSELLGARDINRNIITIDDLIGNSFIEILSSAAGVYIPQDEILKRTAYQWFARMNARQVLDSDTMIGKLLLINCNI